MLAHDSGAPHAGERLTPGDAAYIFTPHPLLPAASGEPYAMEGAEAVVYHLRRDGDGAPFALKAPKPAYRGPRALAVTQALARLADALAQDATPCFTAARRVCLTRETCPDVITRWPSLEYASLMPWITGRSWASLLLDREASQAYSQSQALALASTLALALWRLEGLRGAHTDLAGDNLILTADGPGVELIDLEDLYHPGLPRPARGSQGTAGYQPPYLTRSSPPTNEPRLPWRRRPISAPTDDLWRPEGDRFAGAILLTELLVWHDHRVRAATPSGAESLFQPGELGLTLNGPDSHATPTLAKLAAVRAVLHATRPPLLSLFDRAWSAPRLADCPELGEWALALL